MVDHAAQRAIYTAEISFLGQPESLPFFQILRSVPSREYHSAEIQQLGFNLQNLNDELKTTTTNLDSTIVTLDKVSELQKYITRGNLSSSISSCFGGESQNSDSFQSNSNSGFGVTARTHKISANSTTPFTEFGAAASKPSTSSNYNNNVNAGPATVRSSVSTNTGNRNYARNPKSESPTWDAVSKSLEEEIRVTQETISRNEEESNIRKWLLEQLSGNVYRTIQFLSSELDMERGFPVSEMVSAIKELAKGVSGGSSESKFDNGSSESAVILNSYSSRN